MKKSEVIKELITIAIGQASMTWSPTPSGIYKTEVASKIANDLYNEIESLINEKD